MANEKCPLLPPSQECIGEAEVDELKYEAANDKNPHQRLVHPTWRHYCIAPVCFLFVAIFVLSASVLTQYTVYYFDKNETGANVSKASACVLNASSPNYKEYQEAQSQASDWLIYFSLSVGIPAIFSNIIFGSYSDRLGRKFMMMLCCLGTFIKIILMTIGIYLEAGLYIFIIGSFAEGCTGYFINFLQSSFVYVADMTHTGKSRSVGMAVLTVSLGLGLTITAPIAGVLIQKFGFFITIAVAAVILFIALLCIIFILPETLTKERRSSEKSLTVHIRNAFKFYSTDINRYRYILIIIAFVMTVLTTFGRFSVETLYLLNRPFCWTPIHIGVFGGIKGFIQDVLGLFLVKLFRGCASDAIMGMIGALSGMGYSLMVGLAQSDTALYIAAVVGLGSTLPAALARAMMSSMTPSDKQGAVFAGLSAIETVFQMSSSVVSTAIYSATLDYYPGFVFFVFAASCLVSATLLLILQFGFKVKPVEIKPG